MKTSAFIVLFFILPLHAFPQCNSYFPLKQGSMFEMESFSAKGKSNGTVRQTVTALESIDGGFKATLHASNYDKKGKQEHEGEFEITCENGVARIDMSKFIPQEVYEAYEDIDIEVTGEYLDIPDKLSVGQELPDGNVSMKMSMGNNMGGTMDINITNRVVAGKELVETGAGAFDCFKITYDLVSKMNMMGMSIPINMKAAEWITEGVGVVKTESYNKKEKLTGYTLLKDYDLGQ